jgi:zona occludens toxin
MPITAYSGLPRTGKSYGVVENVIMPALKLGRRVFTNIPLYVDVIGEDFPSYPERITFFKTQDLLDNDAWFQQVFEAGATIVIDECWRLWSAGLKANNMKESHKSFLAEHGHMVGADGYSTEVVLVTQDLAQVASYPRSLVQTTYRSVKLVSIGSNTKFRIDIYEGSVSGPNPPSKSRLRQIFSSYDPKVYKYYKSQTMSKSDGHGSEVSTDSRANILSSKLLLIGGPVFLAFMGFIIYSGYSNVTAMYLDEPETVASVPTQSVPGAYVPSSKNVSHFYDGMDVHIVYTRGRDRFLSYTLKIEDDQSTVTLQADDLGMMGYSWIAFDPCYGQIRSPSDILHVYCQKDQPIDETQQPESFLNVAL